MVIRPLLANARIRQECRAEFNPKKRHRTTAVWQQLSRQGQEHRRWQQGLELRELPSAPQPNGGWSEPSAAMKRVEFQQLRMLHGVGEGLVQQGNLAAMPLVKATSDQQFAHSAGAVNRDAWHFCTLVAESLLARRAGGGK